MKSVVLMVIGAALKIEAFVVNGNVAVSERGDQEGSLASAHHEHIISGKWDYKKSDRRDRMPAYTLGGIGAMSFLAGIVMLCNGKKRAWT